MPRESWDVECGETASSIPESHRLWRRFIDDANHLTWDEDGRPIPHPLQSNSMQLERGEDGLSTSWAEHLEVDGGIREDVLDGSSDYSLVGEAHMNVVSAQLRMSVWHNPLGAEPIDCAHTLVSWPEGSNAPHSTRPAKPERIALKTDLAHAFSFSEGTVRTQRPPGS
jgi:hypothetical protein